MLPMGMSFNAQCAALLHDVVEDTPTTLDDLSFIFSERTVWLVDKLSRPEGPNRPTYKNWIRSIIATGDRELITIKMVDNEHNMSHDRMSQLPPEMRDIIKRYEWSHAALSKALEEL